MRGTRLMRRRSATHSPWSPTDTSVGIRCQGPSDSCAPAIDRKRSATFFSLFWRFVSDCHVAGRVGVVATDKTLAHFRVTNMMLHKAKAKAKAK